MGRDLLMPKQSDQNTKQVITKEGTVVESVKNTGFRVQLDENDENDEPIVVKAVLSGKLRRYYIRITMGDRVRLEFSPHDLSLGRIVYRHKN